MSKVLIAGATVAVAAVLGGVAYCVVRHHNAVSKDLSGTAGAEESSVPGEHRSLRQTVCNKISSIKDSFNFAAEINNNILVTGGKESELTDEQKLEHLDFQNGGEPDPANMYVYAKRNPENDDVCVTLRQNGAVVTVFCVHPGWRSHQKTLIAVMTDRFYSELQKYGNEGPEPVDKKLRWQIGRHLQFLLGSD